MDHLEKPAWHLQVSVEKSLEGRIGIYIRVAPDVKGIINTGIAIREIRYKCSWI